MFSECKCVEPKIVDASNECATCGLVPVNHLFTVGTARLVPHAPDEPDYSTATALKTLATVRGDALPPEDMAWQEGKTARSIEFAQGIERTIARLQHHLARIKSGDLVITEDFDLVDLVCDEG